MKEQVRVKGLVYILQKGVMEILQSQPEHFGRPNTPRHSLMPPQLPKDDMLDICETEKIKSLRVMEWVREENQNHLPPALTERLANSAITGAV